MVMHNLLIAAKPTGDGDVLNPDATPMDTDAHRFRLRITQTANESAVETVPAGGSGSITSAGRVEVETDSGEALASRGRRTSPV